MTKNVVKQIFDNFEKDTKYLEGNVYYLDNALCKENIKDKTEELRLKIESLKYDFRSSTLKDILQEFIDNQLNKNKIFQSSLCAKDWKVEKLPLQEGYYILGNFKIVSLGCDNDIEYKNEFVLKFFFKKTPDPLKRLACIKIFILDKGLINNVSIKFINKAFKSIASMYFTAFDAINMSDDKVFNVVNKISTFLENAIDI